MKRFLVGLLAIAAALLLVALAAGWARLAALSAGLFPVALIALGGTRRGRLGPLALPLLLLLTVLEASWFLLFALSAGGAAAGPHRFLGLPPAAAVQLLGLGLLPLLLVGVLYAVTFERWSGPTAADLERLRALRSRAERSEAAPERGSDGGA